MRAKLFSFALAACAYAPANLPAAVTYDRDVAPILRKNCQGCHRPGEAAPMSFLTYKETRPWASAIKEAVALKKMPPWFADPHYGKFSNDRSLAPNEIQTLVRWAETGAAEGKTRDLPKAAKFVDGWNIVSAGGKPDVEFEMPAEFKVPASGTIEYQYILIPGNFTEDKWVQSVEVRPGNRAVVHHALIYVREPGSKALREIGHAASFARQHPKNPPVDDGNTFLNGPDSEGLEILALYVPGGEPSELQAGQGRLIKAGSDLVFQVHYTTNGKPARDRTRVGLIFAKEPPERRVAFLAFSNFKMSIPAGAPNHCIESRTTLGEQVRLLSILPHMHLRGKAFELRAAYPTGESEVLLNVPRYNFNWQLTYFLKEPKVLPKGTRLESSVYFDNSPNNPNNPDPNADVYWGDQSWEEMNTGFLDLELQPGVHPRALIKQASAKSEEIK